MHTPWRIKPIERKEEEPQVWNTDELPSITCHCGRSIFLYQSLSPEGRHKLIDDIKSWQADIERSPHTIFSLLNRVLTYLEQVPEDSPTDALKDAQCPRGTSHAPHDWPEDDPAYHCAGIRSGTGTMMDGTGCREPNEELQPGVLRVLGGWDRTEPEVHHHDDEQVEAAVEETSWPAVGRSMYRVVGATEQTKAKAPEGVTQENWDRASADSSLGVGHVWTNQRCPAYSTLDPETCTCRKDFG